MAAIVGAIKGGQDHHRRSWDGDVDVDDNDNDNEETPALPPPSPSSSSAARPPPSEDVSASSRAPKTPTSLDGNAAAPTRSGIASLPSATVESPTAAASSSSPSSATATATAAAAALPLVTRRTSRLTRAPSGTTTGKELEPIRTQPTTAASVQSSSPSANASIDPLSQHIFLRTNTDLSKASKLRSQSSRPDNSAADGLLSRIDSSPRHVPVAADVGREKKKGFLGRLSMRASRKKGDANDYASEFGEPRTDGSNAVLFSSFVDAAGFTPHHKAPPRYIRIKSHNKKTKEFDRMFLAQELVGTLPRDTETDSSKTALGSTVSVSGSTKKKITTGGAVWATAFSKDGKYLAAGGRDHVVRVWAVISTPEDRRAQEEEEARHGGGTGGSERLSAPVFLERPVQEFRGHTGEVLDLSWSKNNFLLSTSMDKTVRLWHTSRDECLCTFKHKELVSKVAFHPRDDRFFLAGCLDATLRLWSIPDKNIAFSSPMSDMITAVAFSPDGKTAMAGLLNGFCVVLETDGLKPLTQIHVRSSRGRNAKGSKITGIVTMTPPRGKPTDALVLITSTDARVRIYNLRDKSVEAKFKGHEHASSQLFASFSDDGKYVICGSEDRKAYIWSVGPADPSGKDKYPCEVFDAHSSDLVTTAVFAPTQTRQLLGASGDPIYDLCNPPPVTLMSLEESMALSQSGMSDHTLQHEDGAATAHAPTLHQPLLPPPPPRPRPDVSPAYLARSNHFHGNIIVTSDDTGIIKVFRQDCAAEKRKHESWETGSSFSRKLTGVGSVGGGGGGGGGGASGMIGRSGSIVTRSSMGDVARSRRGSLSQAFAAVHSPAATAVAGGGGSGSSDRILSWRQGIEGGSGSSRPSSLIGSVVSGGGGGGGGGGNGVLGSGGIGVTPIRTERSISPSKASRTPLSGLASDARKQPYAATTSSPLSPHFAVNQARNPPWNASLNGGRPGEKQAVPALAPLSSTTTATTTTRSTTTTTTTARPPNGGATPPSNMRTSDVLHATDRQTDVNGRGNDAARTAERDVDAKKPGPPVPSLTFRPADEDDALRLDPVGASYSFWNLNKWKGIAGLRASLIGGHSGSGSGGGGSSGGADGSGTGGGGGRRGSHNALDNLYERLTTHEHTEQGQAAVDGGDHGTAHAARKSPHQGKGGNARTTSNDKDAAAAEQSQLSSRVPSVAEASDGGSSLDPNRLYPRLSHPHGGFARAGSVISRLSSEMTSSEGEGEGDGDTVGHRGGRTAAAAGHSADHSEGGVEMRCTKCGGRDFKARRTGGAGGVQRLHCSRCGKVVEDDGAHTLI
ncbi:WD40/YVTN repeat-like-containing domain protein [Niveomyces insectorum RCEF 264]|uniref:WD40/YVTN repeat-like-containing domain protein n=1 Tax=Niveomyces insectorum RCEF 264 TaxID=1081102 RepID=A0A167YXR5_9HYPO|nr:WD40/YVTN repeat-like-containing domain protein [Niveomyces insectorum RCEF 264]